MLSPDVNTCVVRSIIGADNSDASNMAQHHLSLDKVRKDDDTVA